MNQVTSDKGFQQSRGRKYPKKKASSKFIPTCCLELDFVLLSICLLVSSDFSTSGFSIFRTQSKIKTNLQKAIKAACVSLIPIIYSLCQKTCILTRFITPTGRNNMQDTYQEPQLALQYTLSWNFPITAGPPETQNSHKS